MSDAAVKNPPVPVVEESAPATLGSSCPLPLTQQEQIVLGHGSGGKLSAQLIESVFLPAFKNPTLDKLDDQAVLQINGSRLVFTTDAFVVTPIFFPGGDIAGYPNDYLPGDLRLSNLVSGGHILRR